jgi:DNA-binding transcriptional LysR family regulator
MTNPFRIPLNALRAIEIVARRGALAPAAEELGVTPGAVSQHIRRAEERLGLELFERTPQGLVPTEAMAGIAPKLREGFDTLADAMANLQKTMDRVLTLTTGNVFASRWLVWRLGRFTALHADIEVRLVVTGTALDIPHSDIDCGIRYGLGNWEGLDSIRLGGEVYSPVAAPALAAQLKRPEDLARVPVIVDRASMLSWPRWFEAAGLAAPVETTGPHYSDPALAFDAAISGQGVLLAVDAMAEDAVRDGRLVRPFAARVRDGLGSWFVWPAGRREPRKTRQFRDWVLSEMGDQVTRL